MKILKNVSSDSFGRWVVSTDRSLALAARPPRTRHSLVTLQRFRGSLALAPQPPEDRLGAVRGRTSVVSTDRSLLDHREVRARTSTTGVLGWSPPPAQGRRTRLSSGPAPSCP